MLRDAISHYHTCLLQSQDAQKYLHDRGVYSEEAITQFQLGFCDGSFGSSVLPRGTNPTSRMQRYDFQRLGLLNERGHEPFKPGIVFPFFDAQGEVMQIYGRRISLRARNKKYHHYLNDNRDVFWNAEALARGEIILCKGLIDALTFWVNGYHHVTSIFGAKNLTNAQIEAFQALGVKRIMLAFGGKGPDLKAHIHTGRILQQAGFMVYRLLFPRGLDPNEYSLRYPLKRVVDAAEADDFLGRGCIALPKAVSDPQTESISAPEPETPDELEAEKHMLEAESLVYDEGFILEGDNEPQQQKTSAQNDVSPSTPATKTPAKSLLQVQDEDVVAVIEDRHYRIRGVFDSLSVDSLRVTLRVKRGQHFFLDTLELYSSRQRLTFLKQAAIELGATPELLKKDLGQLLMELEKLQDGHVERTLTPYSMETAEKEAALELLRDPHLIDRITTDLDASGLVGEQENKLVGYIAMTSRKLSHPLALLVQSTSAAGKSTLLDKLLSFVPPEDQLKYSSITAQSLFYMAEKGMKHKVLAVSEGEGAQTASYSLKLLQSEGELKISSTGGSKKGMAAKEYAVEGPVMIAMTTTAVDIDDELLNRCIVLTVNESRQQTRAIHHQQRQSQTLKGLQQKERFRQVLQLHQNAQRLLRPLHVVNPYALKLTFLDERTRLRRDHTKYLTLIQAVAFLHQHQREVKTVEAGNRTLEYIEVTLEDIALANRLAHHLLGTTLDELPPHTRKLLEVIFEFVRDQCTRQGFEQREFFFSRKELRDSCRWGDTQLKVHLKRLVDLEYLALQKQGRKHFYECLYAGEGRNGNRFLMGLREPDSFHTNVSATHRSGQNSQMSASGRASVEVLSGNSREFAPS